MVCLGSNAFQHSRLKDKFVFDSENKVEYLGFRYLWTDLLYLISVLRNNAGYVVLDALDQANLYTLEYNCKRPYLIMNRRDTSDHGIEQWLWKRMKL